MASSSTKQGQRPAQTTSNRPCMATTKPSSERQRQDRTSPSFHLFLNRDGRWDTTDDFATSFLHLSLFSTALWDLPNSRPVHSLMLSSHLFLCLPCLLPPPPLSLCLARWFWPDLMNVTHDHTNADCTESPKRPRQPRGTSAADPSIFT